jgi:hypothetical protein
MKHVARSPIHNGMMERFNHLIQELRDGNLHRTSFERWEAEIVMDMLACNAEDPSMGEILRRYQMAAERRLARGSNVPMKLSEYLETIHTRRGKAA